MKRRKAAVKSGGDGREWKSPASPRPSGSGRRRRDSEGPEKTRGGAAGDPRERAQRGRTLVKTQAKRQVVFRYVVIKIPQDENFEPLLITVIAGLSTYGLIATIAIDDPSVCIAFELDFRSVTHRNHASMRRQVLRDLMKRLAEERHQPTLEELLDVHREVERVAQHIKWRHSNLFVLAALKELAFVGSESAHRMIRSRVSSGSVARWRYERIRRR